MNIFMNRPVLASACHIDLKYVLCSVVLYCFGMSTNHRVSIGSVPKSVKSVICKYKT